MDRMMKRELPPMPEPDGYILERCQDLIADLRKHRYPWGECIRSGILEAIRLADVRKPPPPKDGPSDGDLVLRAIHNAPRLLAPGVPRWVAVRNTFAVGSTTAKALCHRAGLDPDEVLRKE